MYFFRADKFWLLNFFELDEHYVQRTHAKRLFTAVFVVDVCTEDVVCNEKLISNINLRLDPLPTFRQVIFFTATLDLVRVVFAL